jgi:ribosomal protein L37AE/L43A
MSSAAPFYCPYCGEENLFPHGEKHGEWECRACRRVFAVRFIGLLTRSGKGDHAGSD